MYWIWDDMGIFMAYQHISTGFGFTGVTKSFLCFNSFHLVGG